MAFTRATAQESFLYASHRFFFQILQSLHFSWIVLLSDFHFFRFVLLLLSFADDCVGNNRQGDVEEENATEEREKNKDGRRSEKIRAVSDLQAKTSVWYVCVCVCVCVCVFQKKVRKPHARKNSSVTVF